ncbi:MAG: hypothetical protein ABWY93_08715 [Mycobacterium sp.]
MASTKYIGYLSGAAVAAGVGAALAVAGQGTAHADTDGAKSASSAESKASSASTAKPNHATKDAGAQAAAAKPKPKPKPKPKFDPADTVKELKSKFAAAKLKSVEPAAKPLPVVTPAEKKAAQLADTPSPLASSWFVPNTASVPWDWNPFRAGDPIPEGMPEPIWQLEQAAVDLFNPIPAVQPFVREGVELGYRATQVIPWVNVVLPLSNIVAQVPNLTSGDPVQFKTATQSIVNNLLVTTTPVAILFYGYDEIADAVNLEFEAQQLKSWFYSTTWDVLDLFHLLHNQGESGLPLSPNPAVTGNTPVEAPVQNIQLAAATTSVDQVGSDPFREDDPWVKDMPDALLGIEQAIVGALPFGGPIFREAYEAVYRASQVVPFVNVPIPVTKILQALFSGDGTAIQATVNQLLLTTQPVSLLYYGYDEIVDLLNIEDQGYALKQTFYSTIWDLLDSTGAVHVPGESGI